MILSSSLHAAPQWELTLEVDGGGNVSIVSRRPLEGSLPPAQPLREGLTCLELRDSTGRVTDLRAAPLAPELFNDAHGPEGVLSGGPSPAAKLQYQVLVPRRPGERQSLRFFHVRRRKGTAARAATLRAEDWSLDPRGSALLEDRP